MLCTKRAALTLVELLVVVFVNAALIALLLPAVQGAREAARRVQCVNNLKQMGLASHLYENGYSTLPPSLVLSGIGNSPKWVSGWGVNARILPFLEQGPLFDAINWSSSLDAPANSTIPATVVSTFVCPSDSSASTYSDPVTGTTGVVSYGWCMGDWLVWPGFREPSNTAAFGPNRVRRLSEFADGLNMTMLASDVLSRQHQRIDCGIGKAIDPSLPPNLPPVKLPDLGSESSCVDINSGHTSWAHGDVNQSGMTTAWSPNSQLTASGSSGGSVLNLSLGQAVILDLVGIRESNGGPTYAAVSGRSNHPGGVNILLGDGSVRFLKETVNAALWRALSTVRGNEIISADEL
jgi:prepilin-type processing-associated H-X9-DG protein